MVRRAVDREAVTRAAAQHELEEAFRKARQRVASGAVSEPQAYGAFDDWIMELGDYRLFLNPYVGEWWGYDVLHDGWSPTGFAPGEVIFELVDDHLAATPTGAAVEPPAPVCRSCGTALPKDAKFCPGCGVSVAARG